MHITIYAYDIETKEFLYKDSGLVDSVINDIKESEDFTLTPPPDLIKDWEWNGVVWVESPPKHYLKPLKDRQQQVWEDIKQVRYLYSTSGVYVPSVGKVFHTDDTSVIQYNNIGNMIALGTYEPIMWKVKDNTWIEMTAEVFKELQKAMVDNANRIYQVAEQHKANMMKLENPEEYDYSTGWKAE